MDENKVNILNGSVRMLSKLQVLSVFFADDLIYRIYLRTQVIHQLFEENEELDINKLELFHMQYSTALIELLKKIKKNNEQSVSLLMDEVELNAGLINRIQSPVFTQHDYDIDQQRQASKVASSLRKLYEVLSDNSSEYPLAKNINAFSARYSKDFFYNISPELMNELDNFDSKDAYTNAYAIIHRKLMGSLCKHDFRVVFCYGVRAGEQVGEIYELADAGKHFIFFPARNLFLLCDMAKLQDVEKVTELEKRQTFVQELTDKNESLKNTIAVVRTRIPEDIKDLLAEHYKKLTDMDFLQNISKIDVQANILKSMLNTKMI